MGTRLALWVGLLTILVASCGANSVDDIRNRIYDFYNDARYCTRLLNKDGPIGCTTGSGSLTGTLRDARDQTKLNALVADAPTGDIMVLTTAPMFNRTLITRLQGLSVKGIVVLATEVPSRWSPAPANPQASSALDATGASYQWNPNGDGLSYFSYGYGIVLIENSGQFARLIERVEENERRILSGGYVPHAFEMTYPMSAQGNSVSCLAKRTCLPEGGYSVWATVDKPVNDTKPLVYGITRMDTSAFFRDVAVGADTATSGLAVLMEAASALSKQAVALNDLPRRIVLAFFDGETWDNVGSRRFLAEVKSFTCKTARSAGGCNDPFRPDLDFTLLSNNPIDSVVEVAQPAASTNTYLHREHTSNVRTDELMATLYHEGVAADIIVSNASTSTPGVPPSSSRAFLKDNSATPVAVVADHDTTFTNKFYESRFDDYASVNGGASTCTICNHLCKVSTMVARSLYVAAGGTNATVKGSISADCTQLTAIFECLTQNMHCALAEQLVPGFSTRNAKVPVHYSSVYQIRERNSIRGVSRFIYAFLNNAMSTANANGTAHFHDAVDPNLSFDTSTNVWTVTNATSSELWVESNWPASIGSRAFRRENPAVSITMVVLGLGLTLAAFAVLHFVAGYCDRKFKTA